MCVKNAHSRSVMAVGRNDVMIAENVVVTWSLLHLHGIMICYRLGSGDRSNIREE